MVHFKDQILIHKKPDVVYAFLARVESIMHYAPYFDRVEADPPGILATGSVVHEFGQFRGGANQTQWTVTEALPGERLVFETSNPLSKWAAVTFETHPSAHGTDLEVDVKIIPRGFYWFAQPFIKRRLVKLRKVELGRIKEFLENKS